MKRTTSLLVLVVALSLTIGCRAALRGSDGSGVEVAVGDQGSSAPTTGAVLTTPAPRTPKPGTRSSAWSSRDKRMGAVRLAMNKADRLLADAERDPRVFRKVQMLFIAISRLFGDIFNSGGLSDRSTVEPDDDSDAGINSVLDNAESAMAADLDD